MFIRTKLVRIISLGFAAAITLFPVVLLRPSVRLRKSLVVHERIHLRQQVELLVVLFYILYLSEYLIRLVWYRNHYKAYRMLSFEQEAWHNEHNSSYLSRRRPYAWLGYLNKY